MLCQLGNDKRGLQEQQRNESKQTKKLSTQKKTSNGIEDSIMIDTESTQKNDDNLEQKHESISRRTRNQLKTEEEIKLDKRIEEITDLSSMLMGTHEELDIYDMSHGSIMGILKSEGLVPREWIPPTSVTAPSSFSSLGPTEPSQIFDQFIQQQQQPGSFNQQENSPVYGPFDKNRGLVDRLSRIGVPTPKCCGHPVDCPLNVPNRSAGHHFGPGFVWESELQNQQVVWESAPRI
ncbi:hypothetical protein Pst134EB_014170 [Puccinia striiformis f. sp. tritici]|nr:hypothetical protein Pst134EB_014170 [Puccinia striiformis f. sp. tritici]